MTRQKAIYGMNNLPEMTNSHPQGEHKKQCPNCERIFMTDNPLIVYCSTKCKQRWGAKQAYQRGTRVRRADHHVQDGQYKRTCKACIKEFRTNTKNAKYCSEACRIAIYNKKYYKRHRKQIIQRSTENRQKRNEN